MANKKKFLFRMDPDLWNALQAEAARELRSVNGQIEFMLRRALRDRLKEGKAKPGSGDGEDAGSEDAVGGG